MGYHIVLIVITIAKPMGLIAALKSSFIDQSEDFASNLETSNSLLNCFHFHTTTLD